MAEDYTPGYNPSRRDMEQRQSWTRDVPGFSQLMMGMTQQAREHVAETRPFRGTPTLETGLEKVVRHSPEKKAAIADYVNQQQAGLAASGLEEARANMATTGRGVRMVTGYLQNIQDDPQTSGLHPSIQKSMATRQYMLGEHPRSTVKSISSLIGGSSGDPETAAQELSTEAVGRIAHKSITGSTQQGVNVRKARYTRPTGPVGGVRGRSFGADVAGTGGVVPTIKSEDDELTRVTPGDQPASGQPLKSTQTPSALAGGLGTGRGDDRRVMPASTGYPVRTEEQRIESQSEQLSDAMKGHISRYTEGLEAHVKEHGVVPSNRQLADRIGVSEGFVRKIKKIAAIKSESAATKKRSESEETDLLYEGKPEDPKISREPIRSVPGGLRAYEPVTDQPNKIKKTPEEMARIKAMKETAADPEASLPKKEASAKRRSQRISDAEKAERQRAAKKDKNQ